MPEVQYDPHAELRMQQRRITKGQVEQVLIAYDTRLPTQPRSHSQFRSIIYVGTVDGRGLKVHVRDGSSPPYVTTAAWKDE